jgi:hypothetical protein
MTIEEISDLEKKVDKNSLTHEELIRCQALAQACRYYVETIVKSGDLYRELVRDNRVLKPATYFGVIQVAWAFEGFISGDLRKHAEAVTQAVEQGQHDGVSGSTPDEVLGAACDAEPTATKPRKGKSR